MYHDNGGEIDLFSNLKLPNPPALAWHIAFHNITVVTSNMIDYEVLLNTSNMVVMEASHATMRAARVKFTATPVAD